MVCIDVYIYICIYNDFRIDIYVYTYVIICIYVYGDFGIDNGDIEYIP